HYLGHFPNQQPRNLPPGMGPRGFKARYFYYAIHDEKGGLRSRARGCLSVKCREAAVGRDGVCAKCGHKGSYERNIRPDFTKYSYEQLEAMGFAGAAPKNLKDIIGKYAPFRNMKVLQDVIEKHPTNDKEQKKPRPTLHSKKYREGEFIR